MIKNYLLIAWRNLVRYKGFSFINLAGLTIGLTVCLLIGLFVNDEKKYDRFIPEGERIYRVYNERTSPEGTSPVAVTPPMYAPTLKADFAGVAQFTRVMMLQAKPLFEAGDKKMYEENGIFTEASFFDIFPLPLKYGSHEKALDGPNNIVLSEEMALRYFGNTDPVGKTILLDKQVCQVTAVLNGDLSKFHLRANYILPVEVPAERWKSWTWQQFYTYIKVEENANVDELQKLFRDYVKKTVHPMTAENGMTFMPFLQPLHDIHLYSAGFKFDNSIRGNISYVNGLTIIAVFILLLACFNFINLATAKSLKRAREVGVRKSVGASRRQLMMQFTGETIFLTLLSIIMASLLTLFFLPIMNEFTGKTISSAIFGNPLFLLVLLLMTLVTGILAGIYPALILSGFQPVKVLKGGTVSDPGAGKVKWLRHGLVVVQFAVSALLIVSAIVVYRQVNYLHNKDLGFNRDEIMFFPMRGDNMNRNYEAFRTELTRSPAVTAASIGYGFPGDIFAGDEIVVPKNGERATYPSTHMMVDYDYIKTLNLRLVAGRDFSKAITTDKDEAFIINETAVRELGFGTPGKAIGQVLMWHPWEATKPDSMKTGRIIGVLQDFNYKSLYDKMEIAVLHIHQPAYWKVAVKIKASEVSSGLAHVRKTWKQFTPDFPIEYNFLDENFEQMYVAEDKLQSLLTIFTGMAIFVGCLGLFGLAAYTAERRKKEIGIRKTLGASVNGIVMLLSKDFLKLVLIALLIASPVAWYFMNKWLEHFAFRLSIPWWVFLVSGGLIVLIAFITTSFQAIRAAIANPVRSLRTE